MRYTDLLDEMALTAYLRGLNGRVRQYGITPTLTVPDLRGIILESGGVCGWCAVTVLNQAFEIDHIIPLVDKGSHRVDNLVVSCVDCNRQKSAQHPAKFAQALSVRLGGPTPLIQRVLAYYGIDPLTQTGLFG